MGSEKDNTYVCCGHVHVRAHVAFMVQFPVEVLPEARFDNNNKKDSDVTTYLWPDFHSVFLFT